MSIKQRAEKKSETLEVRIAYSKKLAFMDACKRDDKTASDVIRDFVTDFIRRPQKSLLRASLGFLAAPRSVVPTALAASVFTVLAYSMLAPGAVAPVETVPVPLFSAVLETDQSIFTATTYANDQPGGIEDLVTSMPQLKFDDRFFKILDRNADGVVSEADGKGTLATAVQSILKHQDANDDGEVSRDEMQGLKTFSFATEFNLKKIGFDGKTAMRLIPAQPMTGRKLRQGETQPALLLRLVADGLDAVRAEQLKAALQSE